MEEGGGRVLESRMGLRRGRTEAKGGRAGHMRVFCDQNVRKGNEKKIGISTEEENAAQQE